MDRYVTPQPHDRGAGPAPFAPGDGLAQGMIYTAVVQGTPSEGLVQVTIPALHLSASLVAHVPSGTVCRAGEACCVALDEQKIPWIVASKTLSAPALVSALPAEPLDGQEVYFQNATLEAQGVIWHLRYRAASVSAYKWEFIGGPTWSKGPSGTVTILAVEEKPLVGGPEIVVPLAGEYLVGVAMSLQLNVEGLQEMQGQLRKNGVQVAVVMVHTAVAVFSRLYGDGQPVLLTAAAADKLTVAGKNIAAKEASYGAATLALTPVRVG